METRETKADKLLQKEKEEMVVEWIKSFKNAIASYEEDIRVTKNKIEKMSTKITELDAANIDAFEYVNGELIYKFKDNLYKSIFNCNYSTPSCNLDM